MITAVQRTRLCRHDLFVVAVLWLFSAVVCWPQKAGASGPDVPQHTLTVEARDLATDAPVPNVSLQVQHGRRQEAPGGHERGGHRSLRIRSSRIARRHYFSVKAHREGLVPLAARWNHTASSPTPPDHLRFQMEKATTISGRVLDQNGQPLADAVVVVSVKKSYPKSQQWVDVSYESTRTDAQGHWSFTGVPEQPDSVELASYHYLCLTEHAAFYLEPFKPLSALRDGSAVLRLRRGTLIEGTVLSPDGRPVADAEVCYGEERGFGNSIPPLKANAQGKFTLGIKPGTHATLIALSPGFAPTLDAHEGWRGIAAPRPDARSGPLGPGPRRRSARASRSRMPLSGCTGRARTGPRARPSARRSPTA